MNDFGQKGKVVITCKDRFAPYLEKELVELGFKPKKVNRTSIELYASLNECIYLNLHLRTASHVLFEIKSFYLQHADDIYRRVKALPWENYIANDTYFSVSSHVENESVDNPLFVNVRIKDAIVDRFRENTGSRPDSGSEYLGAVFQMYWKDKQAILYINTSGDTIAKHGYRKIPGKAPMLEALVSATLMAADWNGEGVLVNPMCGSGTVAIEAAMVATNRYPGLYRDQYAFQYIKGYDEAVFDQMKADLKSKVNDNIAVTIIANDISEIAINGALENAKVAGVKDHIIFEKGDFADVELPETEKGIIFINPEYGERLGEETELEETYKRIGDYMKQKGAGYTGYIFTGNLDLAKKIGLKAKRRMEFYNGTLDCRLLKYELYKGSKE
ncbi:class I SAM-dependent RNA methyltransferase [Litoribacter ruber]|uniref:Class I SAM-dependent RNA methyltransferase n=1 Tax=Litoribacter ruber TaxID=702568 RepID=A0AAP2G5K2_9BACT|nr:MULTISPECIES: THUMP domain-containing protein [Litoribacter]MBS9524633.1 class I SAM-dependent RNA methyltransferase [Litoribacter alkaliphilus]MBT0810209.1 class I SAM-dependent RNA methyltransferase [Litoribacter ruber]